MAIENIYPGQEHTSEKNEIIEMKRRSHRQIMRHIMKIKGNCLQAEVNWVKISGSRNLG